MNNDYHVGEKQAFIQLLKYLLPKLPYRSLGQAIWEIDLPMLDEDKAVEWILEYCSPTQVCLEPIDTECPNLEEYHEQYSDIEVGEVIVLARQTYPKENGVYVYTSDSMPLIDSRRLSR